MKRFLSVVAACAVALMVFSCGSKEVTKTTPIQEIEAPDWVKKGSGAFDDDKGKVFYGVGSASNIGNYALLRSTADNRARSEIAKIFEFYTASLMKDYTASTSAGEANVHADEQHVEEAIKTVSSATLSGVEIVDHWQHPATGELFSLAKLDLESFKDSLQNARELNARAREFIRENADKLHQELKEEEERMLER